MELGFWKNSLSKTIVDLKKKHFTYLSYKRGFLKDIFSRTIWWTFKEYYFNIYRRYKLEFFKNVFRKNRKNKLLKNKIVSKTTGAINVDLAIRTIKVDFKIIFFRTSGYSRTWIFNVYISRTIRAIKIYALFEFLGIPYKIRVQKIVNLENKTLPE